MFKLLKWAVYGVIGYALYEFVAGIFDDRSAPHADPSPSTSPRKRGQRRPANMTGSSGQGRNVSVADSTGAEHRAKVGRGVLS